MKFLHLNVNSTKKHQHELINTFHDIDRFSLNETKLSPCITSFSFNGFDTFRLDRNAAGGGGVLIAIKQVYQSILLEKGFMNDNEYVVIECKRKTGKPLTIASIYVPPRKVVSSELLNKILSFNDSFLILGDFNANHTYFECQKTNKNGRVLFEWVHDKSVSIIGNNDETFQSNDYDWILADFETAFDCNHYSTHPLLGSAHTGHKPIIFPQSYPFEERSAKTARKKLALHKANWILYKTELNRLLRQQKPREVSTENDLIDYNHFLTECINKATDRAIPPASSFKRKNTDKPSRNTLDLIKYKHHLYRRMKKDGNNQYLRDEYYRY